MGTTITGKSKKEKKEMKSIKKSTFSAFCNDSHLLHEYWLLPSSVSGERNDSNIPSTLSKNKKH